MRHSKWKNPSAELQKLRRNGFKHKKLWKDIWENPENILKKDSHLRNEDELLTHRD